MGRWSGRGPDWSFTNIFSSPDVFSIDGKLSLGSCFKDEVDGGLCFHHQPGVQRLLGWVCLLHVNALYEIPISSAQTPQIYVILEA